MFWLMFPVSRLVPHRGADHAQALRLTRVPAQLWNVREIHDFGQFEPHDWNIQVGGEMVAHIVGTGHRSDHQLRNGNIAKLAVEVIERALQPQPHSIVEAFALLRTYAPDTRGRNPG